MRNRLILLIMLLVLLCTTLSAKVNMQNDTHLKHSLGSSLFLLGNVIPEDAIYAFQLDYSYRLTQNDVLMIEGIT